MSEMTITPSALAERRRGNRPCDLIDVRTPVEFREVHVEFARNVPLDHLDPEAIMRSRGGNIDEPLYVICKMGSRSQQAVQRFRQKNYQNVMSVEGGTQACENAGLPVVHGKKAISLERQVRIAAGSLVFIGVLLGFLIHPVFFGLSGFVGAGLLFAGLTDTCGMAMLLARMPWNQCETNSPSP